MKEVAAVYRRCYEAGDFYAKLLALLLGILNCHAGRNRKNPELLDLENLSSQNKERYGREGLEK